MARTWRRPAVRPTETLCTLEGCGAADCDGDGWKGVEGRNFAMKWTRIETQLETSGHVFDLT